MLSPFWAPLTTTEFRLMRWFRWGPVTRKTKHWITDGNPSHMLTSNLWPQEGRGPETKLYKESWTKGFRALLGWCSVEAECLSLSPMHRWPCPPARKRSFQHPCAGSARTWVRAGRARAVPPKAGSPLSVIQGFWFQSPKCCLLSGVLR